MVSKFFIDFIVFSFLGWIYECIYCTLRTKHWQNRGFLFGPVCPIYGSAAVAGMVIFGRLPVFAGSFVPAWKIFLISALASAVLEFVTSWVLEKLFHAVWWDYSRIPLNIQGRISLPTTTGFGLAGILVVRFLIPFVEDLQKGFSTVSVEIASLLLMAFFAADLALTVASLTQLLTRIEEVQKDFNTRMEAGYRIAQQGPRAVGAYMAGAAKAAGAQMAHSTKEAAQTAGALLTDAGITARRELAEKIQKHTGLLSGRELHHINAISRFKEYQVKAPVIRLHEAISGLMRRQAPVFRYGQEDTPDDTDTGEKERDAT